MIFDGENQYNMKTKLFYLLFAIVLTTSLYAQNYQIGFAGTGASSSVDSVKVENLTQCTSINLGGGDILHLAASLGVNELNIEAGNQLHVYPNPMTDFCWIDFNIPIKSEAIIGLYDIVGRKILQDQELLIEGQHIYQLKGIPAGMYALRVECGANSFSSNFISNSACQGKAELKHMDSNANQSNILKDIESEKSIVDMQYNTGDLLKITGKSGVYRTVVMLTPTSSQTLTFTFISCSDANGNNYPIVKIGNQWWMAENLNAGTYATITTPQVSGTKFCMNVNGQADPNCPMGGLYEWANLMQGSSPCNGSGAPPNDMCNTPVKGLCPNGWHIPSHYEWTTLEKNSGSNPAAFPYNTTTISLLGTDEGANLKATCTDYWWDPNAGATNLTGFSGLPGGDTWNGVFEDFGQSAYFWTSTETFFMSWVHALNYSLTVVGRSSYAVESGFSCRCVKDN